MSTLLQEGTTQSATFTSNSPQNSQVAILALGYSTALVTLQNTGSVTGGAIVFEGFDGFAWYTLTGIEIPGGTNDTSYSLSGGSLTWYVDITGYAQYRTRLSSVLTGTGSSFISVRGNSQSSPNSKIGSGGSGGESNVNINEVGGAAFALGQTTKSGSLPVTLASDQGTISVQDSSAESSLSTIVTNTTGLATASAQTTGNSSLATIATNTSGLATSANQTNGNQQVQGNVASGSSDSGNAVKIGAVFNTTLPTYTTGQRGDAQMGSRGAIMVQLAAPSGTLQASVVGSGDSMASQTGLASINFQELYNNSSFDRQRNNTTGSVIAAGATTSNAGVSTTTYNASKAVIIANISAFTSGSLTVAINGITSSGYSYPILTSTALSATGVTPLRIFPGATPSANATANDMVPRTLQVVTTVSGTLTYGIDYELSV